MAKETTSQVGLSSRHVPCREENTQCSSCRWKKERLIEFHIIYVIFLQEINKFKKQKEIKKIILLKLIFIKHQSICLTTLCYSAKHSGLNDIFTKKSAAAKWQQHLTVTRRNQSLIRVLPCRTYRTIVVTLRRSSSLSCMSEYLVIDNSGYSKLFAAWQG